jgi:hypothetical protein
MHRRFPVSLPLHWIPASAGMTAEERGFLGSGEVYGTSPSTHPKLLAALCALGRISAGENAGVIAESSGLVQE